MESCRGSTQGWVPKGETPNHSSQPLQHEPMELRVSAPIVQPICPHEQKAVSVPENPSAKCQPDLHILYIAFKYYDSFPELRRNVELTGDPIWDGKSQRISSGAEFLHTWGVREVQAVFILLGTNILHSELAQDQKT